MYVPQLPLVMLLRSLWMGSDAKNVCQMADMTDSVQIVAADLGFSSHDPVVDNRTSAQQVYETLKASFPNLRGKSAYMRNRKIFSQSQTTPQYGDTDQRADRHRHRAPPHTAPQPQRRGRPREARPRAPVRPGARDACGRRRGQTAQARGLPPDQVRRQQRVRLRRGARVATG